MLVHKTFTDRPHLHRTDKYFVSFGSCDPTLLLYLLQLFTLSWSVQVFSMISDLNLARQTKFMLIGNTIFVTSARVWGGLVSIDFLFIDVKIVDVYGTCCAVLSPALCWHRARTNNRWDSFCQQLQCWMGILARERFRSSSSYQSSEASEIMHLKVLFDLHHSDSSPLNGSGNGELIFVYRLEDFPWFPIKTSLSLRSLEYQFQYPRSCLELPESWLKGSGGHTTARGAAESSQQQQPAD